MAVIRPHVTLTSRGKKILKEVVKEELKEVETLNTTFALLQMQVDNLKAKNNKLQIRCSESNNQIDEFE